MNRQTDVIVLNSHGVGQYAYADRMPKWGETMRVTRWHIDQDGGKGTNISVALGRLGLSVSYIGKVGNDPWGDLGEKWMQDAGVDTTFLYRTDEVATGTALILLGPHGENAIIDGDSSSQKLTIEEVLSAIEARREASMFITGFEIPQTLSIEGAKHAKSLGMTTFLNPSPLPESPIEDLSFVDYLTLNEIEAEFLLNISEGEEISPRELAEKLKAKYKCANIILTLGEKGSCLLDLNEQIFNIEAAKPKEIINTAGAGDGYLAALAYKLFRGSALIDAAKWASKYAALTVTIHGTIPAYRPLWEVESFIEGIE
ncbi:MAG: ribokinase [Clostridia bacterium]|nr:ribokinase [Clostridia bacterium]